MAFGDFVQGVFTDNPGSPSGVSVGTVTAGNLLIAAFGRATNSTPTVTDNLGNTWAVARSHYNASLDYRTDIWYAVSGSSGACTITITSAGGAREAIRAEFAGPYDATPLDVVNSGTGSGTTASSGNVTPSVTGVLALGYHAALAALTSSGSWATRVNGNAGTSASTILQSQVRANTTAFAATATLSSNSWQSIVATFKPAVGGGTNYDVSLALAVTGAFADAAKLDALSALALSATGGFANDPQLAFLSALALSAAGGFESSGGLAYNSVLALGATAGFTSGAVLSLLASLGLTVSGGLVVDVEGGTPVTSEVFLRRLLLKVGR